MSEKTIEVKKQQVEEVKQKFEKSKSILFYDYRGLTVDEVSELRNQFRAAGVEYKVIKNNILRRAAKEQNIEGLDSILTGPTAAVFGYNDAVSGPKVLVDFVKKVKKTEIKVGVLSGDVVDVEQIKQLASLPTREELIAKLAGTLNAPIGGLAMALNAIPSGFARALAAVRDQKQA
ncbi:MAG: 50S ribosomal protein L10 [Eubacteriales bacterium]